MPCLEVRQEIEPAIIENSLHTISREPGITVGVCLRNQVSFELIQMIAERLIAVFGEGSSSRSLNFWRSFESRS